MKKINLIATLASFIISSCNKHTEDIVMPKMDAQSSSNTVGIEIFYKWDQLPTDLKNALPVNPSTTDKYPVTSCGPYGSTTGTSFSSFPPKGSKIYAMGMNADNAGLNKLIIWYKGTDNKIYYSAAGSAVNFIIREFSEDEYITKVDIDYASIINKLSITTNKKQFSCGVSNGSAASVTSTVISYTLAFWGRVSNNINQLYVGKYYRQWTLLPGSDARDIAVSPDGTAYMTNTVGKIYKFTNNTWTQLPGSDGRTIATNGNRVVLVNTVGKIYELFGNTWVQLPNDHAGKDVAINDDNTIWMVGTDGLLYFYDETKWVANPVYTFAGYELKGISRIAAGGFRQVCITTSTGDLYYVWSDFNGAWNERLGVSAKDVAIDPITDRVWMVKTSGEVYYDGVFTGISSGANISAGNGVVYLTQSNGAIRKLTY